MEENSQDPTETTPQPPTSETTSTDEAATAPEEAIDLNELFPEEDQNLNDLFPEKELRTLLQKVHKSHKDLHKINTRFVDDTEMVVPHLSDEETAPSSE